MHVCLQYSDSEKKLFYSRIINMLSYEENFNWVGERSLTLSFQFVFRTGREVVFQCRDEGPIRARVHWVRRNNRPLPPGARDINGRLEIPNILMEHGGEYVCEAVGYPKSQPGSFVTVQLTVEKRKSLNNSLNVLLTIWVCPECRVESQVHAEKPQNQIRHCAAYR